MPPSSPLIPPVSSSPPIFVTQQTKGSIGPIFGTIIILMLLIVGALYLYGAALNRNKTAAENIPTIPGSTTVIDSSQ